MKKITKKTSIICILVVLAVIAPVSIVYAYFSDYVACFGTAELDLRGQTEIVEEVTDAKKVISIRNMGDADVIVRVAVFGPDELTYEFENSGDWVRPEGSDFYYYTKILRADASHSNSTGSITAKLDNIKADAAMPAFDITVVHECAPVILDNGRVVALQGWEEMPAISE